MDNIHADIHKWCQKSFQLLRRRGQLGFIIIQLPLGKSQTNRKIGFGILEPELADKNFRKNRGSGSDRLVWGCPFSKSLSSSLDCGDYD